MARLVTSQFTVKVRSKWYISGRANTEIDSLLVEYTLELHLVPKSRVVIQACYAAYDTHLANYTLYNRFLRNMICCHNTLFTKTN